MTTFQFDPAYRLSPNGDWVSYNIPVWRDVFANFKTCARNVLEIGSHEGRTAIWLVSDMLHPGSVFHAVDQWTGHPGEANQNSEPDFDHNMTMLRDKFPTIEIVKHKSDTVDATAALISAKMRNKFDLIYVDGTHTARNVLEDLTHVFPLCKPNGIIICDDYTWAQENNAVDRRPKMGIDNFTNTYADMIEFIPYKPTYQIFLRKRETSTMQPL